MQQKLIINRLYSVVCHLASILWRLSYVFCPLHLSRTLYKSSLFMQNKPNFRKSQMNVNIYYTKVYKNETAFRRRKNKPNSNPIKPNCRKGKIDAKCVFTKGYRKKDDFAVRKNKPNSNPIPERPKMSANAFSQKDYENKTAFRPQKNKPNSNPIKACPERSRMGGYL